MKSTPSPIQKTHQPSRQSVKLKNMNISIETMVLNGMKLKNMNISIETMVLIMLGASDMRCVKLRAKMLPKVYRDTMDQNLILTHTDLEDPSTKSPVNETQKYEY